MAAELAWAWQTVRDTDDIHAVVLRAAGDKAFCTGVDVKGDAGWFFRTNVWNTFDPGTVISPKLHHRCWKPVVTAVHGFAAGGAQYLLNESDIIICADDAAFFDPHANAAIVSALEPIGMLHRGVPLGEVLRWALMGTEERISADDGAADRAGVRGRGPRRAVGPGAGHRRLDRDAQSHRDPGQCSRDMGVFRHDQVDRAAERDGLHPYRQPAAARAPGRAEAQRPTGDAVTSELIASRVDSRRAKLAGRAAEQIVADVVELGWPVGRVLGSETELLDRYGVSRAVLREAIRLVEHQHVARMRRGTNGGLVIVEPDVEGVIGPAVIYLLRVGATLDEVFDTRIALEELVAEIASQRAAEADIAVVRETLERESAGGISHFRLLHSQLAATDRQSRS